MSDDAMVEEFFAEVNDKYYPQVVEGLELLDSGQLEEAVETLSRPLHTIKGVTGFMTGFEQGSHFTHKVEDFLKAMQAGSVSGSDENLALAARGVNMVFQVLEQIRDMGAPEKEETEDVLGQLAAALSSPVVAAEEIGECFVTEEQDRVTVLRAQCRRVHTEADRILLIGGLAIVPDAQTVLIDMTEVLTCSSSTWEDVAPHAERLDLHVCGLTPTTRDVFLSWGFDRLLTEHSTRERFFEKRKGAGGDA